MDKVDLQQTGLAPAGEITVPKEKTSEEQLAASSVFNAVRLGMVLSKEGVTVNNQPFFIGNFEDFVNLNNGEQFFNAQVGVVDSNTIFSSIRDSWDKLCHYPFNTDKHTQFDGLPHVRGKKEENTQRRVVILSGNSDAGTDFCSYVLPTAGSIYLYETGAIECSSKNGEIRPLTGQELRELTSIFEDAQIKLQERVALRKQRSEQNSTKPQLLEK